PHGGYNGAGAAGPRTANHGDPPQVAEILYETFIIPRQYRIVAIPTLRSRTPSANFRRSGRLSRRRRSGAPRRSFSGGGSGSKGPRERRRGGPRWRSPPDRVRAN